MVRSKQGKKSLPKYARKQIRKESKKLINRRKFKKYNNHLNAIDVIAQANREFAMNSLNKEASLLDDQLIKPTEWFKSVGKGENVQRSWIWRVNKEEIFNEYFNKHKVYNTPWGKESTNSQTVCDHMKYSHEEVILPNGAIFIPIRQFCDTKILPVGTNEAFFYNFQPTHQDIVEGTTISSVQQPSIQSSRLMTRPRGSLVNIGYNQLEKESPLDIVGALNRSFSLESVRDENKIVLNTLDSHINKNQVWLDNNGNEIAEDSHITNNDNLTIRAVNKAINILVTKGYDPSKFILYTSGKGLQDLINDKNIASYVSFKKTITQQIIEQTLGIKVIREKNLSNTSVKTIPEPESIWQKIKRFFRKTPRKHTPINGKGNRSILFVDHVTFGLVSGDTITMEALRQNEFQSIGVTGTSKLASVILDKNSVVRISHS